MAEPQQVAIEFSAEVRQVKTMSDLSANLTLNVPEMYKAAILERFGKWQGMMVRIIAVLEE